MHVRDRVGSFVSCHGVCPFIKFMVISMSMYVSMHVFIYSFVCVFVCECVCVCKYTFPPIHHKHKQETWSADVGGGVTVMLNQGGDVLLKDSGGTIKAFSAIGGNGVCYA